ncbi:hypothetical protein PT974_01882 [Cladobotryum mycophilum]|uniref:Short-chain alcohol dehydrogenase n=1 Tax=Cladobotryum mycophilum TaxID=491253 RepID=A0ABR0SWR1_9HYPO
MTSRTDRPLVVIGSGPGIGRHVALAFAAKRYNKVALVARNPAKLKQDQEAVEAVVPGKLTVKTYSANINDGQQLSDVLVQIEHDLGTPETVFYNAAQVVPSKLLEVEEDYMVQEFKTTCTGVHVAAKWGIPLLQKLGETDPNSRPTFLVTSSLLPADPIPDLFVLSMVKAAQKNMVQSMAKTWGHEIHIGVLTVGGVVDPSFETLNPLNIASQAWKWFDQPKGQQTFEMEIL